MTYTQEAILTYHEGKKDNSRTTWQRRWISSWFVKSGGYRTKDQHVQGWSPTAESCGEWHCRGMMVLMITGMKFDGRRGWQPLEEPVRLINWNTFGWWTGLHCENGSTMRKDKILHKRHERRDAGRGGWASQEAHTLNWYLNKSSNLYCHFHKFFSKSWAFPCFPFIVLWFYDRSTNYCFFLW